MTILKTRIYKDFTLCYGTAGIIIYYPPRNPAESPRLWRMAESSTQAEAYVDQYLIDGKA